MELQINHFGPSKGHTRINSANEYDEPDVLNTFCATRVLNSKFCKECISSLALLSPKILQFLKDNFSFNIGYKEHVLIFTSFLAVWNQFISNKFISLSKAVCK